MILNKIIRAKSKLEKNKIINALEYIFICKIKLKFI